MHGAAELLDELFFGNTNTTNSLFGVKAHGAIVAALNNVPGNAGNRQARSAEHDGTLWQPKVTI